MNICIYGAASRDIDSAFTDKGVELGLKLAERGHNMVYGGGDGGMMGAVARGAHRGGAHITGVAPSFFNVDGMLYADNDELIYTETMRERKQKMEDLSSAFIVTPGGIGTFEEFFEILTLKQLGRLNKPIVMFNINGYYDPMSEVLRHTAREHFMSEENLNLVFISDDIDEIFDYIEGYEAQDIDIAYLRNLK